MLSIAAVSRRLAGVAFSLAAVGATSTSHAQTPVEVPWWHSMGGALGDWVHDLAKGFNESQKNYKLVPTFKWQLR